MGGGGGSPMQSVLSGLLGGGQQQGGSGMRRGVSYGGRHRRPDFGVPAGGARPHRAILGGQRPEPAGLARISCSRYFGQDRVQSMASQAGMQPQDFLSQLSQHLPAAVDGMTPGGALSLNEGTVSV